MLSLRYRTPLGDKVIWPSQYTWLLQERLTYWKHHSDWGLSVEGIQNKSITDNVAKLIALYQVLWFLVKCILRVACSLFHPHNLSPWHLAIYILVCRHLFHMVGQTKRHPVVIPFWTLWYETQFSIFPLESPHGPSAISSPTRQRPSRPWSPAFSARDRRSLFPEASFKIGFQGWLR